MTIGIIGAMDKEVELIINKGKDVEKIDKYNLSFYKIKYLDKIIVVVKSGVGKVNASIATTLLKVLFQADIIISTGIAGGMKPLKTGDICLIEELCYGDVDVACYGYELGRLPGEELFFKTDINLLNKVKEVFKEHNHEYKVIKSLTSDKFVTSMPYLPTKEVYCFEMESTAIAHTASHLGVPVIVIRYISDLVDDTNQIENYNKFESYMALKSQEMLFEIVEKI